MFREPLNKSIRLPQHQGSDRMPDVILSLKASILLRLTAYLSVKQPPDIHSE